MQTKSALKIIGTSLFLYGVFGFLFPHWHNTFFTNNENLFHLLTGLVALVLAESSALHRRWTLVILALLYLVLGLTGFSLNHPADFHIKHSTAQLDEFDNYVHILFGLLLAWFWLTSQRQKS